MHQRNRGMGILLLAATLVNSVAWAANEEHARRVTAAIDSLRGLTLEGLSDEEKGALGTRLDKAWDVLREHKKVALPLVRRALAEEREDSFLILDLSDFLLRQNSSEDSLREIAGYVIKADPNAYSRA